MILIRFGTNMEHTEAATILNQFGMSMELMGVNTTHFARGIHIPQTLLWWLTKKATFTAILQQMNTETNVQSSN